MDAIVCDGLTKRYGRTVAIDGLNLTVPRGSIFGFLGPNGAGKSTVIRLLVTLSRATSGDAEILGASVADRPEAVRRMIGYLPQEPAFPGWMQGREFLLFSAGLADVPSADRRQRTEEALAQVGLSDAASRRIGGYSGGMKQRLGLAQALLAHPPILILDEPVSSLDPIGRREIIEIMNSLRGETTIFFSSHILDDIDRVCDHVAILAGGKLVVQATMLALKQRFTQPLFLIDVASDGRELACELQRESWVESVQVSAGQLRVAVRDVERAEHTLPGLVLARGETLVRYEQVLPSLEDVFVRLVEPTASAP